MNTWELVSGLMPEESKALAKLYSVAARVRDLATLQAVNIVLDLRDEELKRIKNEVASLMATSDTVFIDHIRGHLHEGQDVICKICGKTATEICKEMLPDDPDQA